MKKSLFWGLGMLLSVQLMADNVIKINDESVIENVVAIRFDPSGNGKLLIYFADNTSASVNMNVVKVEPDQATSIDSPIVDKIGVVSKLIGSQMTIEGLKEGETIRIFDLNGKAVHQSKAQHDTPTIDLSGCQSGTYIMRAGDKVVKFNKQ